MGFKGENEGCLKEVKNVGDFIKSNVFFFWMVFSRRMSVLEDDLIKDAAVRWAF